MREFGEMKQGHYPRDMEAPIYIALQGRLAREGNMKSKCGLGEFGCAEDLVPISEIASDMNLPFELVKDFAMKNGIEIKKHPYRGTLSVDEDDGLDILLVNKGIPTGTNVLRALLKQNAAATKRCEEIVKEHDIQPIWSVNGTPYYTPEQGDLTRKLYFEELARNREARHQEWKKYKDERLKQGKHTEHQNSPWARGYRGNSYKAPEGYMTQREVIDMLHVTYKDIQNRLKTKRLTSIQVDGRQYLRKEDVIRYGEYRRLRKEKTEAGARKEA